MVGQWGPVRGTSHRAGRLRSFPRNTCVWDGVAPGGRDPQSPEAVLGEKRETGRPTSPHIHSRSPEWQALTQRPAWLADAKRALAVPLGRPFLPKKTSDSFQREGADYLEGRKNTGNTSDSPDDRGPEELRGEL